jgi:hypothetical protein
VSRGQGRSLAALGLAWAALACSRPLPPILDCAPAKDARPVCGFHNPEDLALLPNAHALVVSQMGALDGTRPGSLVFFDLASDSIAAAYPPPAGDASAARVGWGDAHCPGPPGAAFSPHGLDLARRPDGALALWVVNHGGRESVELFEVSDAPGAPALAWRGCVLAPEGALLNDVAALPDGGFVTTKFLSKSHPNLDSLLGLLRIPTGYVLEWQAGSGFHKVAGSDAPLPNGIAVSPDGETLFVDVYLADEVRKLSRRSGEELGTAQIASPDNLNWAPDGQLLVASHNAPLNEIAACADVAQGQCPFHFSIVRLDPERMKGVELYENHGPPMGAGTSALCIGDELVIGSFAGDRLLRVTLPESLAKPVPPP